MTKIKVGTQIPSSTGGVITFTATGLIHTAGKSYSGKAAETDAQKNKEKSKNR